MSETIRYPRIDAMPVVTTEQMIEVDRRMMDDVGISLFQMMENAGLLLASIARDLFLKGDVTGKRIAVMVGTGGNGGGAIVAARRLVSWGAQCDIGFGRSKADLAEVPRAQFGILERISKIKLIEPSAVGGDYDLIIDGLIGYSLKGAPHGRTAEFIGAANKSKVPVLSLDVPSGFDGTQGQFREPSIDADATMTLALPKFGMMAQDRPAGIGRLFCADISCPPVVYENLGIDMAYEIPFVKSPIVELS
ncbi:MAG: NAD(P)H-hydrate epimerase [Litoreibacter sp.]